MATQKISGRLQTPADSTGSRTDIHLITTTDEVIVSPESEDDSHTLTEELERIGKPQISNSQPNYPCVWLQPKTL